MKRHIVPIVALLVMIGLLVPVRAELEKRRSDQRDDYFSFLPDGKVAKRLSIGYDTLLADYYWIEGIAYLQFELKRSGKYENMAALYQLITDLDPQFEMAYVRGALFISSLAKDPTAAVALLKKGNAVMADSWQIPYQLSQIYLVDFGDIDEAVCYMKIAASHPRAPELVTKFASGLESAPERYARVALYWIEQWDAAKKDVEKAAARNRTLMTLSRGNRALLENVIRAYRAKHDADAALLVDLWKSGDLWIDQATDKIRVRLTRPGAPASTPPRPEG